MLSIIGSRENIYETMEQFAWLSASLRFGGHNLSASSVELKALQNTGRLLSGNQATTFRMRLEAIHSGTVEEVGICWMPMFDRSVLAWGFEVAQRGDAVGVEMTLDLMLQVCGTRFLTD
jgi:hypothetical protein